ncbi:MAG: intein-containing DNA gyrase subunit A, partial [Chloroflexota bacterium]|nr:intein-containing DNA gyrase subunit A [Chloroflexota bacterium]
MELVADAEQGKVHLTYSVDAAGRVVMAPIQAPRLTKRDVPVVKVTLDNGEEVVCTPDHRFMLRDGTYREAQELRPDVSLMPLYTRTFEGADRNLRGYEQVYQPAADTWEFAHRLADEFNIEHGVYSPSAGRVRHHRDLNKRNNDPRNVVRLQWADHRRLHAELLDELWSDQAFRARMSRMLAEQWSDPQFRATTVAAISKRNRRLWQDPEYRARQTAAVAGLWADPDFRERILRRALEANVLRYGTPAEKAPIIRRQREALRQRWQDPAQRALQSELMREVSNRLWADPEHRQRVSECARRQWTEEHRAQRSSTSKALWQDPQYRQHLAGLSVQRWRDPHYRAKFDGHLAENGRKAARSRFLSIARRVIERDGELTAEGYERERRAAGISTITRFKNGLSWYCDGSLEQAKAAAFAHTARLNHRVVSVEPAGQADVYDLTVDGLHNFALAAGIFVHNSVDNDPAAAMRYTEARLTAVAEEMMADIDKETVEFGDNFDATEREPLVLPARLPNLLLNGAEGIAVGMATKIPPHNLSELVDGITYLIDHPDAAVDDLLRFVHGPDFPTAGLILGTAGIRSAYATGRGRVVMRAKAEIEEEENERRRIVVTELPYQVNKATLQEKIAELVGEKRLEGISNMRDESDRQGMHLVIELKRDARPTAVLNQLFKHTALQTAFNVNMVAVVGQQPQVMTLKTSLQEYVRYRQEIVTRRSRYDLRRARERAHILEGLQIALDHLDEVIRTIREAQNTEAARGQLVARFALTEVQATAILDLQLRRLVALERQRLADELAELRRTIADIEDILARPERVLQIIKDELAELRRKYGDPRRTIILPEEEGEFSEEDLVARRDVLVLLTERGYVKRMLPSTYRLLNRGGKGVTGMTTRDDDQVRQLFVASTHDSILFFTNRGRVLRTRAWELPDVQRQARGSALINFIALDPGERVTTCL